MRVFFSSFPIIHDRPITIMQPELITQESGRDAV